MPSELPYLEVFLTVCDEGGFTAAARRLGRTQPTVSYQVRSLEQLLQTRLVERGGRRLLLTPSGERLRAFCVSFFGELARVRGAIAGGPRHDSLRIGSASGFGRYVLMPALLGLRKRLGPLAPTIDLRFDAADVVLRNLERGDTEAAFLYTRRVSNRLRFRPVYEEELVLIAPARPARRRAPRDLRGFEAEPFVTYVEGDYVFGRWFEDNFGEQPDTLTSVAHFSELEEVVELVRQGAGLSIVPRDAVARSPQSKGVRILYAGRRDPCLNQVYLVTRADSAVRPEVGELVSVLGTMSRK